jgi:hypothetical protein
MFEAIDQHQKFDEVLKAVEKLLIDEDIHINENQIGSRMECTEIPELNLKRKEVGLY